MVDNKESAEAPEDGLSDIERMQVNLVNTNQFQSQISKSYN